jgi:hypothetical protein
MGSRYFSKRLMKKRPKQGPLAPVKPKAFKTEASAEAWAKKNKVKKFRIEQIAEHKFKLRTKF